MALTEIELIYQAAADLVGEIEITENSNQNVKPYSTCARHYPQARDEIVRGYAWNEATELAVCLEDSTKPAHTFTHRFALPSDCLRPLHTTRPRLDWRIMGDYTYTKYRLEVESYTVGDDYYAGQYLQVDNVTYLINTNFTATSWAADISNCTTKNGDYGIIKLEYVKSLDNPTDWSVQLRQAIILNLAAKIVVPITSDQERRTTILEELHRLVLPHAFVLDAMQGKPKQFFYSEYLDSRGEI